MFVEDFTYRQLDGVIINPGSSDYAIPGTYCTRLMARTQSDVGTDRERRRNILAVYRTFIEHRRRICLYYGLQRFASSLDGRRFSVHGTVDTAFSYGDLISWHGDKLVLIGLDDPVISAFFLDGIPP